MKKTFLFSLILANIILLTACNQTIPEAKDVGLEFYNYYLNDAYQDMYGLFDTSVIVKNSFEKFKNILINNKLQRGDLINVKIKKIKSFYDNAGNYIIEITFESEYLYGIYDEILTFIKRKNSNDIKILNYKY